MGQVALQAKAPQLDLSRIEQAAQRAQANDYELQNAPARSELEALKLQDEIGGQSALAGYRDAQGAGDPQAIDKLKAYPKIQKDVYDAFDGMKPEEYMFAKKKARAFGRAAQYVLSLPKDSPEQKEAWDESLGVLRQQNYIDDTMYRRMIEAGPSDLVLQQAMTVDDYVKQYGGKNAKVNDAEYEGLRRDKIRAEIEKLKQPGKTANGSASNDRRLIEANRALSKWEEDNLPSPEELAKKKAEIWARMGLGSDEAAAPEAPATDVAPEIPQGAIDYLRENPDLAGQFDVKYGEGAAASVLGDQ
jgi:hypothetical protein